MSVGTPDTVYGGGAKDHQRQMYTFRQNHSTHQFQFPAFYHHTDKHLSIPDECEQSYQSNNELFDFYNFNIRL